MRHVASSLVFFKFLCCVQCQRNKFVTDIDLAFLIPKASNTSNSGWNPHDGDRHIESVQFQLTPAPDLGDMTHIESWLFSSSQHSGRRMRRQVFQIKNEDGFFRWSHIFSTQALSMSNSKDSTYLWQESMKRLKNALEKADIQFLKPSGLKMIISGDNINMRIVDFRLKFNEEFRDNDGGHFAPKGDKIGGRWTYVSPEVQAKQGDKVYYWMQVRFDKEGLDVIVKGVVEVTQGNPHSGFSTPFYPPTAPAGVGLPQPEIPNGVGFQPAQVGGQGPRGAYSWRNLFSVSSAYNAGLANKDTANNWMRYAQLLKNSWSGKDKIKFRFFKPNGVKISFPDININMRIDDVRVKLNEDFRDNDGGHFAPTGNQEGGRWTYDLPQVKVSQGDKLYYYMRLKLGTEEFNAQVKGLMEVTQGDPHVELAGVGTYEPITKPPPPFSWTQNQPSNLPPPQPPTTPTTRVTWYTSSINQVPTNQNIPLWNKNEDTSAQTTNGWMYQPATPPSCNSQSTRNGAKGICSGEIMYDYHFNSFEGWTHQVSIGGKYPEDEFTCFTKDSRNSYLQQGRLVIRPTLLEEKYNATAVRDGELNLLDCTYDDMQYCRRQAQTYNILPPVSSARLNTKNHFSFRYGTVEIRAKLPRGDWIVPELWLEPVYLSPEEKVVIGVSRGNRAGLTGHMMEAGVLRSGESQSLMMSMTSPTFWSQGFHNFKLEWTPDYTRFFVDNNQIYQLSTKSSTVLSQEVYISLGVHVGGYRDFPDNKYNNKPWKNSYPKRFVQFWEAKSSWHPTWRQDPTLQVEYVKITAL